MARPPKPTALKLIQGNPGKRATGKQEPDPTYLADLTPPGWLSDAAAQVWEEVAPRLARNKLLTEVDVEALAMGCTAMAQYRLAAARVGDQAVKGKPMQDAEGNVVLDKDDKPVMAGEHINPWAMVQSMTFKQAMVVFAQFGMTPQARTRIALQPQGDLFDGKDKGTGTEGYFT
jgi:P27 family predicted phage terminase small subunit